jgi:hypothetical protein
MSLETSNSLAENRAGYENITTLQGIETPDNDLVRKLLNTTACKEPLTDSEQFMLLEKNRIHTFSYLQTTSYERIDPCCEGHTCAL